MGTVTNQAEQQTQVQTTPEAIDSLLEAARYDDIDDITSLASSGISLDSKDSLGRTALHMAAANGHLDIVEYLISQGVLRVHRSFSFSGLWGLWVLDAVERARQNCISWKHLWSNPLLCIPSYDLNASNEEKNTPLHWACLNGHIEVVKKLILAGASLGILNSHERTPMDEAVTWGKLDVIDAINAAVAQMELAGVTVS
ncbi:unnamed protein product [Dovyalis caffra]|uniref:Uncharacterized protein n=1 Tax=Dovyalis caffra TaxID=77055 RepID=A0AAV1RCK8_9ROSI|nr:unnamed protein product [Dovyalis caffra]